MRQKTKQKIIDFIAQRLSLENTLTQAQVISVWAAYLLQPLIFHIVLLVSIAESHFQLPYSTGLQLGLVITRIVISLVFIYTKSPHLIPLTKTLQIINIYILRTQFSAIALVPEFIAEIYLAIRKQKRYVNFDSRLESKFYATKIFAIYILLMSTFLTSLEEIKKIPSAVLFTAIIFYVGACLDQIYSYKTKEILRTLAICPIMMAVYFLCEPLVPALNTFGLLAHSIISLAILIVIIVYAMTSDHTYHNPILFKKIINLESRDKVAYIWALICFVQAPTYNQLVCFIKTHQSKCFNTLCPLNSSITHTSQLTEQNILKSLKIYLKKCLQRFASESDEIRRLFIYYRQQDDPKITYLLKQTDIYEKIQQIRITKNLASYTDPSLEYEQMKEIQQDAFLKVKLFLNHYEYFLSYLNKDVLKLETSEEIIEELLKIKTYFLSFKPNVDHEKAAQTVQPSSQKIIKNSKGYQQLQTETIPLKKMTVKTILLVNFMRRVYFNLPSLEKQEFTSKKITYIDEDVEQTSILVISAESHNLGKVMNWNSMAQKVLLYPTKQLKQKYVNDMIPQPLHKYHQEILMKGALRIQLNEPSRQISTKIFCFTKPGYVQVFETRIAGANSISGNKWVVEMQQHFDKAAILILDEQKIVIGVNKNALKFGLSLNVVGEQIDEQLFQLTINGKKQRVRLQSNSQPIQGFKMQQQTQWQLMETTIALDGMQRYFIVEIDQCHQIEKTIIAHYSKRHIDLQADESYVPKCTNGFQFNFDPYQLKFTNLPIPSHSSADLQLIWQSQSPNQQLSLSITGDIHQHRKQINFGENIHQMIYFDKKLQFKENFQQSTEFQTHPNYLPGGKMVVNNRGLNQININKQNFIENLNKIKNKTPSFLYRLTTIFIVLFVVCVICLSLRLVYFNKLYTLTREKQLVIIKIIARKNLVSNIGSLAVYTLEKQKYPNIWDRFLTNKWTFPQLFVGIEYSNGEINKLNGQIGWLINKGYEVNGKMRTLASYFEALSIQASGKESGELNLTRFTSQIVNEMSIIEVSIQKDIETFYSGQYAKLQQMIWIIDIAQLALCLILFILMHYLLRKVYMQRVHLFKSLTCVQEEEIQRILSRLNEHRENVKNNQLDSICLDEDYEITVETQTIKHQKKLLFSYLNSKIVFFYILVAVNIVAAGLVFLISEHSFTLTDNIKMVKPFVDITGEQWDSMTKLYLKTITQLQNDPQKLQLIANIKTFEKYKKGLIDSLIQNKLSDQFTNFYNTVWFNPCNTLQVSQQCNSLFSGILSDNLDYNYVYILTELQKVTDFRSQILKQNNTQFTNDANLQIQKAFKKINFLLFEFMTKLQQLFDPQLISQIDYLYNTIGNDNLRMFLIALFWIILISGILAFCLYKIKNLPYQTLQMLSTALPLHLLMRNQYFVEWYKDKFRNIY